MSSSSMLTYGMQKARGALRYLKPMPGYPCSLPEPKSLIVGARHRIPVEVDLSGANGEVERDPLKIRIKWFGETSDAHYGGEVPLMRGVTPTPTQHVVVTVDPPETAGTYAMAVFLARGSREVELQRSDVCWPVVPLSESDGLYHYGEYMIGLDATTDCNLECIFCLRVFIEHTHNHHVTPEEMKNLAEQAFDGCSGISLSLGAEPLLNRHMEEILQVLGDFPYVHTTMTTNGLTLSKKNTELLVENRYREITVSIDGATAETFESIRKKGNFERLIANLKRLHQLKQAKNTPYPKLKINVAMMKRNVHELPDLVDLAHELGAHEVHLQYFMIPHESLTAECLWFDKERSNSYLEQAIEKCHQYGMTVDAPPLFSQPKKKPDERELRTQRCHWPWKGMLIDSDGNALPCCQWKGESLGNVNQEGFQAVWNGERYQQLRRDWITGDLNESCRNCSALMQGDVNDFSSFFAAEYHQINGEEPPLERLEAEHLTPSTKE